MTTKVTGPLMANTAVSAGTYGSGTTVGSFTVDAQGRITSASQVTITGSTNITGGSAGAVLYQSGSNQTAFTSVGTSTYLLQSAGSGTPTWLNPRTLSVDTANSATSATSATTATTANALNTNNTYRVNGLGVGTDPSGTAGEIRATNNITAYYSDDNLKTRLGNIENALDKVCSLTGFYYEANQTAQDLGYVAKREVGVSAQDVQKILPEIVVPAPISDKYLTVHYDKLIPLLIEAIKELKTEVNSIKEQIK